MTVQTDFLERCKALNLHDGKLSDWLDEIESLRQQLAAALAACKQKDESLEVAHNGLRWWMDTFPFHVTETDNEEMLKLVKALAIQPDDDALKAFMLSKGVSYE